MLQTTNITSTVVANELGSGKNRAWSYLCKHPNINKWSLYKPVSYNKVYGLTDTDYFACNFGYNIPRFDNYRTMKAGVTNSWEYDKPTGGQYSQYRIGDFRKYDHNATAPFILTNVTGEVQIGNSLVISTPNDIAWLTNWDTWKGYQGNNIRNLNCGFYVPNVGFWPLTNTTTGPFINELDPERMSFTVSSDKFAPYTQYSVYLVLTSWNGLNGARRWYEPADSEGGLWWVLATTSPLKFQPLPPPTPTDYIYFADENASTYMYPGGTSFTTTKFDFIVNVKPGYPYNPANITCTFIVRNTKYGSTGMRDLTIGSASFTGLTSATPISRKLIIYNPLIEFYDEHDRLNVDVEIQIVAGSIVTNTGYTVSITP